ncbi:MAG: MmgE/PrpD family protein [Steroidobacteraceae bacterium]
MSAPDRITARLVRRIVADATTPLPEDARRATETFILDSLGVALSGTRVPLVAELATVAAQWGAGDAARVWGTGQRVPAATAAFLNGYQIHNQEWDCVHEPAVVHPMAVVLSTLLAYAEQRGGIDGRRYTRACATAVDVAATIGCAATNKLRFFRPAMCGALGATAGIAQLERFDEATTRSALGLAYSQLSGTMQAHVEGSPVLPMQIAFNTRAALVAIELARRGVRGPQDFLEGPFGYYTLIDPEWDARAFDDFEARHCITELSHKPYPSGRATHGGVDGALTLMQQHGFAVAAIAEIRVLAPPLVIQLVDRAPRPDMAPSYARLCAPYVIATALQSGNVDVLDFEPQRIADPQRQALAGRIRVVPDGNPSLNALAPQRVEVQLHDGSQHAVDLPAVLGAPGRPLSRERHLAKFRRAASSGARPLAARRIEDLIRLVDELDALPDMRRLVDATLFEVP